MTVVYALRSLLFYLGYIVATIVWGSLAVLCAWALPYRARFTFVIGTWTRMVLFWLRVTCGIRHEITGRENLPDDPCIVFVKHESTWETLFMQSLVAPQATVIKRELLWIPFFGWAFTLLRPIAINRRETRNALQTLINVGTERLDAGVWIVLFPEGTRTDVGEVTKFQIGGAALAAASGRPLVVVAHNAGNYWPAHAFIKHPGTISVHIAPPIDTRGKNRREINELARAAMMEQRRAADGGKDQTSRLTTDKALDSMNSRLGST